MLVLITGDFSARKLASIAPVKHRFHFSGNDKLFIAADSSAIDDQNHMFLIQNIIQTALGECLLLSETS